MSTLTSIFGMLPLMLVPGVGSQIYRGLATVIIGGMFVSAIFTLILMPSILKLPALRLGGMLVNNKDSAAAKGVTVDA
jgi:HAE1 family hydrophobic/amphiphilic exporter-1